jgi:hypothetical protein
MQVGKWNPFRVFRRELVAGHFSHVLAGLTILEWCRGAASLLIESSVTNPCVGRFGTVCCTTLLCFCLWMSLQHTWVQQYIVLFSFQ